MRLGNHPRTLTGSLWLLLNAISLGFLLRALIASYVCWVMADVDYACDLVTRTAVTLFVAGVIGLPVFDLYLKHPKPVVKP